MPVCHVVTKRMSEWKCNSDSVLLLTQQSYSALGSSEECNKLTVASCAGRRRNTRAKFSLFPQQIFVDFDCKVLWGKTPVLSSCWAIWKKKKKGPITIWAVLYPSNDLTQCRNLEWLYGKTSSACYLLVIRSFSLNCWISFCGVRFALRGRLSLPLVCCFVGRVARAFRVSTFHQRLIKTLFHCCDPWIAAY